MAHLYGDFLYYATSMIDHYMYGIDYSRPEKLYFWGYFFFANSIWLAVPGAFLLGAKFSLLVAERANNFQSCISVASLASKVDRQLAAIRSLRDACQHGNRPESPPSGLRIASPSTKAQREQMPSPRQVNQSRDRPRPLSTPATPFPITRSEPPNAGATAGPYSPANIRNKIAKWQNLNADALAFDDVGYASDAVLESRKRTANSEGTLRKRKANTDLAKQTPLGTNNLHAQTTAMTTESRSPSSPKKRIVSDEHWMKDRLTAEVTKGVHQHNPGIQNPVELPRAGYEYDINLRAEDGKFDGWVRRKKHEAVLKTRVEVTPNGVKRWTETAQPVASQPRTSAVDRSVLKPAISREKVESFRPKTPPPLIPPAIQTRKPQDASPKKSPPKPIPARNLEERKAKLEFFAGRSPPKPSSPPKAPKAEEPPNPFATLEFITGCPISKQLGQPKKDCADGNENIDLKKLPGENAAPPSGSSSNPRISAWLGGQPEKFEEDKPRPKVHKTEHRHTEAREHGSPEKPKLRPRRDELEELRRERRKNRRRDPSQPNQPSEPEAKSTQLPESDSVPLTPASDGSPVKSADESPSTPGLLRRRGAKHDRAAPRRRRSPSSSPNAPPKPPSTVWSADASVHPDDSASVVMPREPPATEYESRPIEPLKITKVAKKDTSPAHPPAVPASVQAEDQTCSGPKDLQVDNNKSMELTRPGPQRHVTTDDDLMSILSRPDGAGAPLKSACSLRSRRNAKEMRDANNLLADVRDDEEKYGRELKTLIDGVIPVLLTSAMSQEKSKAVSGLFGAKTSTSKATAPIVNMGIALERLRSLHRRMPLITIEALVAWGEQGERVYADYINAWRMGFQDVVVNLAPGEGTGKSDDGLKRDEEGFVINDEGRKIDVAFLLKRPLVRVKNLAKTFKTIAQQHKTSASLTRADKYQDLVEQARRRQNDERARLEDEAAASIDCSRARDPRTLAPLPGVQLDPSRCVRARDTFDLNFRHSTGQRVDCRVELLLRDDRINQGTSGDVLICELEDPAKWLLLPPIQHDRISSRIDGISGDLIVMVRGPGGGEQLWQEIFSLRPDDDQSAMEWHNMLGSRPVPPALDSTDYFSLPDAAMFAAADQVKASRSSRRKVSPSEIEVPLGEQASAISRHFGSRPSASHVHSSPSSHGHRKHASEVSSPMPSASSAPSTTSRPRPLPQPPTGLRHRRQDSEGLAVAESPPPLPNDTVRKPAASEVSTPSQPRRSDYTAVNALRDPDYARKLGMRRRRQASPPGSTASSSSGGNFSVWMPASAPEREVTEDPFSNTMPGQKPALNRRDASAPTYKSSVPDFGKKRREREALQSPPSLEGIMSSLSLGERREGHSSSPVSPLSPPPLHEDPLASRSLPSTPAPHTKHQRSHSHQIPSQQPSRTPPSKLHQQSSSTHHSNISIANAPKLTPPSTTPNDSSPRPTSRHRRASSPLKHEWDPSSSSDASLNANFLDDTDVSDAESLTSVSDAGDVVPSLPSYGAMHKRKAPATTFEPKNTGTVAPSNSASQIGASDNSASHGGPAQRIASLFAWSDTGAWTQLQDNECAIVLSPGLIEAFDLTKLNSALAFDKDKWRPHTTSADPASPSNPNRPKNIEPLLALELTPLVPLRRGTAIDISIRSPPTAASTLPAAKRTKQFMLRSRTNTECDTLYAAINHARIHNPTYIAMQNANPTAPKSNWAAIMDSRPDASVSGSRKLFGLGRKSSYRAKSRRTPSIAANTNQTQSSVVDTLGDALGTALKRLANPGSKAFSLAKSSVDHGPSSSDSGTFSSSSGANASGLSTPPAGTGAGPGATAAALNAGIDPAMGTPLGISNLKVRLYERQQVNNTWRDKGSARLTVLQPPRPPGAPPPLAPDGRLIQSKRILILGKTKGEMLLDVTLGETSFERVGRVGIAINVWERRDGVESKGSVMSGRARTYMIQCKGEAEAGFMFGLVGRAVRY
ncbi:MAG: hypothetical protein Q9159_006297 [Coniocarpon cinnabarinum]